MKIRRRLGVWVTGPESPLRTMDDVFAAAEKRPIVFGHNDVGSTAFVDTTVVSNLLSLDVRHIAGFSGSRAASLAAVRGEVDFVAYTFESILDRIESGDLRLVLQVADTRVSPHAGSSRRTR